MKRLFLAAAIIASLNCFGQFQTPQPDNKPKEAYTHIVIYRLWEGGMIQRGDMMGMEYGWQTKIQGFHSLQEIMAWLSYKENWLNETGHMVIRLTTEQLIGIYDLHDAKQIKVKLVTEEKSLPKRVEIQAEKWTEQKYVIEN